MKMECRNCRKLKEINLSGKSEGLCHVCYKKLLWKPKLVICKRCNQEKPMHAFGLCNGCYTSIFQMDKVYSYLRKKRYNVSVETYDNATKQCVLCGFDKVVDLHHLDHNKKNNSPTNLIGLCPNHHKMLHHREFQAEVFEQLKEKGFSVPKSYQKDELFK